MSEFWCGDCKFFGHADMGGEGWCDANDTESWYGKNAMDCAYFKMNYQIRLEMYNSEKKKIVAKTSVEYEQRLKELAKKWRI